MSATTLKLQDSRLPLFFQFSVAVLVMLASIMLSIAEGATFPMVLTIPVVIAALFLTDLWKRIVLNNLGANILGIVAFLGAIAEFAFGDMEARLLSGAHLLVYLMWVVQFQFKSVRQYWWICALATLQVAVGAVLSSGSGSYGLFLILYLFVAIWTLSLYSLYLAEQQFSRAKVFSEQRALQQQHQSPPVDPNIKQEPPTGRESHLRSSETLSAIQQDPNTRWIGPRFVGGVFVTSMLSLMIAAVFFAFIPRLWPTNMGALGTQTIDKRNSLVGFTPEVKLGDIGEILDNTDRVLELQLFDNDTGEKIIVEDYTSLLGQDEPLFRGTVLNDYDNGEWKTIKLRQRYDPLTDYYPSYGMVRQEITLYPIGSEYLFGLHPIEAAELDLPRSLLGRHFRHHTLAHIRDRGIIENDTEIHYTLYSRKVTQGRAPTVPAIPAPYIPHANIELNLKIPRDKLKRLTQLAEQIAFPDETPRESVSHQQIAERLVNYLKESGKYSYSTTGAIIDPNVDPVIDFLFNRKEGHCEYYATSLTLMLRAVGIPARMVSGFKGGRYQQFTDKFVVEQRHAHTWVEAWIDRYWITYDATPAARQQSVEQVGKSTSSFRDLRLFIEDMWRNNVVQMTLRKQKELLYDPLKSSSQSWYEYFTKSDFLVSHILQLIKDVLSSPQRLFSVQGAIVSFILLTLLAGVLWACRLLIILIRQLILSPTQCDNDNQRMQIEFYERFREICAKRGVTRKLTQTQQEFAHDVASNPQLNLSALNLTALPENIAKLFYRVRFGNEQLKPLEFQHILRELENWDRSLTAR